MRISGIERDWEVFVSEGAPGVGAVREISAYHIMVYIEGFGDQRITADQIASVHDGKVVLDVGALPEDVRKAIAKAHDAEDPSNRDRPPVS